MRNSERKRLRNRRVKSRLRSLKKKFLALVAAGKKDDAANALRDVTAALDKAAKTGVVHKATANRAKSRLALRLNQIA
mgnify:CR=1 FL=1